MGGERTDVGPAYDLAAATSLPAGVPADCGGDMTASDEEAYLRAVTADEPEASREQPEKHPQYPQNPGFEGIGGGFPGPWPSPQRLPGRTVPLPLDALGDVLGRVARAIATARQVPADLAVNVGLAIITTAAKGRWIVEVEPGWTEPVCVATLSALASGEGKSPTVKRLAEPLRDAERDRQNKVRPERSQASAKRKLAEDRAEEKRRAAVKAAAKDAGTAEAEYLAAVQDAENITVEPLPRWLVDDATPEKFVDLLAEQDGALGSVSAEPGVFGILAGRYSNGAPQIEWFLQATSGEALSVERMGRDGDDVPRPALSVACCIQPGRLIELGRVKTFRESGLLARFLYAVPASVVGERGRPTPIDSDAAASWDRHVKALAVAAADMSAEKPAVLTVSAEGREALEAMRARYEPELHPGHGRYAGIADWMNKLSGAAVRIATALTLIENPDATEISTTTMRDAIRVAEAYVSHAVAAFGMTRPNAEGVDQARQVLATFRKLAGYSDEPVSRRAVYQKLRDRAWVENAESLAAPLRMLAEYDHIRRVPDEKRPGRPSERYWLHPSHLSGDRAPLLCLGCGQPLADGADPAAPLHGDPACQSAYEHREAS